MIVINTNFLTLMHGSRDNEVLLQAGYDVIVISSTGGASRYFIWSFLKEGPWLPDRLVFRITFSSGMHGFRVNEVLSQAKYDIIVISPLVGVLGDFSWGSFGAIRRKAPKMFFSYPQYFNFGGHLIISYTDKSGKDFKV